MLVGWVIRKLQMCKDVIVAIKQKIKECYQLDSDDEVDKLFDRLQKDQKICYEAWG